MTKYYFRIGFILAGLLLGFPSLSFATLTKDKDYMELIEQTEDVAIQHEKIEVIEFFSYGCPYCYVLEPELISWLAQKPDNVTLIRIAIPRKGRWVEYARLFYALGMISPPEQERIIPLIYAAIHEQKLDLDDADKLIEWAVQQGINRDDLNHYYFSQAVTDKLAQSLELAQSYNLKYVPSIYVDNRYELVLDSKNQYQGTKDKLSELIKIVEK